MQAMAPDSAMTNTQAFKENFSRNLAKLKADIDLAMHMGDEDKVILLHQGLRMVCTSSITLVNLFTLSCII